MQILWQRTAKNPNKITYNREINKILIFFFLISTLLNGKFLQFVPFLAKRVPFLSRRVSFLARPVSYLSRRVSFLARNTGLASLKCNTRGKFLTFALNYNNLPNRTKRKCMTRSFRSILLKCVFRGVNKYFDNICSFTKFFSTLHGKKALRNVEFPHKEQKNQLMGIASESQKA